MSKSAAKSEGRQYHHGDLRNALRAAASELIRQRGAESVSLREISQAAGVSHAAAYRHYADKQALLADLAELGFRELADINRAAVAATPGGPVEQLRASGQAYVEFGVQHPHLLQLMFAGVVADWQAYPGLVAASGALADALADIIRAGQASGELKAGPGGDLTLAAWSMVHGLTLLIIGGHVQATTTGADLVRSAAQRSISLLIDGMCAPGVR